MSIRAMIIDDEPFARDRLRELCGLEPDVSIVGEASHTSDAIEQVAASKPNLLLLDVQMRGDDGFNMLRDLPTARPLVVFVSAHEQYALEAFEVDAVDYLLKPFGHERFQRAMSRVRERLKSEGSADLAKELSHVVRESVISATGKGRIEKNRRIVVEREGRMFFLAQDDIDSLEANRNYVIIRSREESFTLRWTMQQATESLDPAIFLRVHRSVIINTHRIREMERWFHGEYAITLMNGQRFTSGRAYRRLIQQHLKNGR